MTEKEQQIMADAAHIEALGGAMVVANRLAGKRAKQVDVIRAWYNVNQWKRRGIPARWKLEHTWLQAPAKRGKK